MPPSVEVSNLANGVPRRKRELSERFQAVDQDGVEDTIEVYTTFTEPLDAVDGSPWVAGAREFRTLAGDHLNLRPDGTFVTLNRNRVLQRVGDEAEAFAVKDDLTSSPRNSAMAIIEAEHVAFNGALSWIRGQVALAQAHQTRPDPSIFERGLTFIATFMEQFHHPKEDEFLFKAVREQTHEADEVLATIQHQHAQIPGDFRNLQLALSGTRSGGSSQFGDFVDLFGGFAHSQAEHMRLEGVVFAMAERVLRPVDWEGIDIAFRANRDPLFGSERGGLTSIMARR